MNQSPSPQQVGTAIEKSLKMLRLSKKDAANFLEISVEELDEIYKGNKLPTMEQVITIRKLTDASFDMIITGREHYETTPLFENYFKMVSLIVKMYGQLKRIEVYDRKELDKCLEICRNFLLTQTEADQHYLDNL